LQIYSFFTNTPTDLYFYIKAPCASTSANVHIGNFSFIEFISWSQIYSLHFLYYKYYFKLI